jgi:N-acyl-D-amino-acid deacylase
MSGAHLRIDRSMLYDIVIKRGKLLDGTGNPSFEACLSIRNGRIKAISKTASLQGDITIDAKGKIIAPGFIDYHNHSDLTLLVNPLAESYLYQGVTTIGIGNCGQSSAPISHHYRKEFAHYFAYHAYGLNVPMPWSTFSEYFQQLEQRGLGVNVIPFVGHGTVRIAVMGFENRAPKKGEMEAMKALVEDAFLEGVFSLSTGLDYVPNIYANTAEIIELCKVAAQYGGTYTTHTRGAQREGVEEALKIGLAAKIPVHVLHAQYSLPYSYDSIKSAQKKGLEISFDAYPYDGGCGALDSQLQEFEKGWLFEGGPREFLNRLHKPHIRQVLKQRLHVDWRRLHVAVCHSSEVQQFEGNSIHSIAETQQQHPVDVYCDLLLANEGIALQVFRHALEEIYVIAALQHPLMIVGSDGWALADSGELCVGVPHPRCYGTFPRILSRYVREQEALSLAEAVAKMTSIPAQRLGLLDRGILRKGMRADVIVFDPLRISDRATYDAPHQYSRGIDYVIVNGQVVLEENQLTGKLAGRILKRGEQSTGL